MKLHYWTILLNAIPSLITAESLRGNALDQGDNRQISLSRKISALESVDGDIDSEEEPALFEGDIVPTVDYIMQNYGEDFEKKLEEEGVFNHDLVDGKGSITMKKNNEPLHGTQTFNLWPDRVNDVVLVPWAFRSGQFSETERTNIKVWIDEMARQSGVIRFVPYTDQSEHIEVQNSSSGCWSYVGKIGGKQSLNLSSGCVYKGVTQHEFLHALGFSHEQSRTDRDTYVTINWDNIPTSVSGNFEKRTNSNSLGSPYDFGSVMHYSAYAFAIDRNVKTIITKNGESIGQRSGASDTDIEQIRLMYQCSTGPRTLTEYNQNKCTSACPCWPEAEGCSSDDECQGSATCVSNTCKMGPTHAPSPVPTRTPVIEPTATPTTARPTGVGTTCYDLEFATTDTSNSSGEQASNGSFSIDGYGTLPKSCHDTLTSLCKIRFCTNTGVMKLRAGNTDGWKFTITGDIGELLDKITVPGGTHHPPFPTWMDTDQFDSFQMYKLDKGLPQPSSSPSQSVSNIPSRDVTKSPSSAPSKIPSISPSSDPSKIHSISPSSAPSQDDDSFKIRSTSSSLCLTPKRVANGNRVLLESCSDTNNSQKWTIDLRGRIKNVSNSNLCLKKVGTSLQVAKCLNNHNFKFDHSSINNKLYLIKNGAMVAGFNGVATMGTQIIFKKRINDAADQSWDIL